MQQQRCILATQRNTLTGESNRCACGLLLLEIRTPTHCKLIARIMTASLLVLSPSSILPQPSSHYSFTSSVKNSARFENVIISFNNIFKISLSLKLRDLKLRTSVSVLTYAVEFNPLNTELNPICYLLALLGAHHFLHVSRIRVKSLTLRLLMSYICIYMEHLFLMFLE